MNSKKLVTLRDLMMGNDIVTEEPEQAKQRREQIQAALNSSALSEGDRIQLDNSLTELESSNFEWGLCEGYRLAFRVITEGLAPMTGCLEEQAFALVKGIRSMNSEQIQSMREAFTDKPELLKIIDLAAAVAKGM